ncbi:MAG: hypothetical protein K6G88_07860 [Lachnospiraceae bacterium]|jgi:hypothetical protein|nr:hypothetical protein [Lachnospiraceae bacterium]
MEYNEKIEEYKEIYGFEEVFLSGYMGGYPILTFVTNMKQLPDKKTINKYLRNSEMSAGRKVGVGLNFRKTAVFTELDNGFSICGHIEIIDRMLKYLYEK